MIVALCENCGHIQKVKKSNKKYWRCCVCNRWNPLERTILLKDSKVPEWRIIKDEMIEKIIKLLDEYDSVAITGQDFYFEIHSQKFFFKLLPYHAPDWLDEIFELYGRNFGFHYTKTEVMILLSLLKSVLISKYQAISLRWRKIKVPVVKYKRVLNINIGFHTWGYTRNKEPSIVIPKIYLIPKVDNNINTK